MITAGIDVGAASTKAVIMDGTKFWQNMIV